MLERDGQVLGLLPADPLMIAADVAADERGDSRLHHQLRLVEPFCEPDGVALGLEAAEELGAEPFEVLQVPRFEVRDQLRRHALRTAD
jgi:hypothetical protein